MLILKSHELLGILAETKISDSSEGITSYQNKGLYAKGT